MLRSVLSADSISAFAVFFAGLVLGAGFALGAASLDAPDLDAADLDAAD